MEDDNAASALVPTRLDQSVAQRIAELPCGDRMKGALLHVAEGLPYREAARAVEYADHREVYRWAKRAGLLDVHSEQLVAGFRRVTGLASNELERRLADNPEDIGTKDLAVVMGIASDKLAKAESWGAGKERGDGASPRWANAINALLEQGGATLTVKLEPAEQQR